MFYFYGKNVQDQGSVYEDLNVSEINIHWGQTFIESFKNSFFLKIKTFHKLHSQIIDGFGFIIGYMHA